MVSLSICHQPRKERLTQPQAAVLVAPSKVRFRLCQAPMQEWFRCGQGADADPADLCRRCRESPDCLCVSLFAEQIQIFFCAGFITVEAEQKVCSCRIGGGITLRCVRPVEDISCTVCLHNNVRRVKVAVTNLVVLRHTL